MRQQWCCILYDTTSHHAQYPLPLLPLHNSHQAGQVAPPLPGVFPRREGQYNSMTSTDIHSSCTWRPSLPGPQTSHIPPLHNSHQAGQVAPPLPGVFPRREGQYNSMTSTDIHSSCTWRPSLPGPQTSHIPPLHNSHQAGQVAPPLPGVFPRREGQYNSMTSTDIHSSCTWRPSLPGPQTSHIPFLA